MAGEPDRMQQLAVALKESDTRAYELMAQASGDHVWAVALHNLGWAYQAELGDDSVHFADLAAYLTLVNATKSEQFRSLDSVLFIIRTPSYSFDRCHNLVIGELLPIKEKYNTLEIMAMRHKAFSRILKDTLDSNIVTNYPWLSSGLVFNDTSKIALMSEFKHMADAVPWFMEHLTASGGSFDKNVPQDNYSAWFGRVYVDKAMVEDGQFDFSHIWGTKDILDLYCSFPEGTNCFSRDIACYPNVVFYHRCVVEQMTPLWVNIEAGRLALEYKEILNDELPLVRVTNIEHQPLFKRRYDG